MYIPLFLIFNKFKEPSATLMSLSVGDISDGLLSKSDGTAFAFNLLDKPWYTKSSGLKCKEQTKRFFDQINSLTAVQQPKHHDQI